MALNPLSIFAGPSPLPPQTGTVTNQYAPTQYNQGQTDIATGAGLTAEGSALTAGGTSALNMAAAGQLTPEQQASLDVYTKNLKNTAMQEYSSLGIAPNKSTSFISTEEDIATKTMAAAQAFIQSTIALGGTMLSAGAGLFSAGASFTGLGQQAEDAATKDLLATAQMQVQQDQAYSKLIGDTLGAIGKIFASPLTKLIPGGGGDSGGQTTYEGNINTAANPSFTG